MPDVIKPKVFTSKRKFPRGTEIIETIDGSLRELFFSRYPRLKGKISDADTRLQKFLDKNRKSGVWVYYPWASKVVHSLPEDLYFELRTNRNKNLITKSEQLKYRKSIVGVAGLSVGSSIVSTLVITGGPKIMKIADFDSVEVSNLNRIRAKLTDVGMSKAFVAAREAWEVDPFLELEIWDKGISLKTIKSFIAGSPKLDILIDEMDNVPLKIAARLICQAQRIPVVMATDNGDGVILDVERFDLEPRRKIFHGLIKESEFDPEAMTRDRKEWLKAVKKIIGVKYMTKRHVESLKEIGRTLAGVPQIGTAAFIAGAAVAFAVRKIAVGEPLPSGRYLIDLEHSLSAGLRKL